MSSKRMIDVTKASSLLQALQGFPAQIREMARNESPEMPVWQPAPDAWSMTMVLAHLTNCEPHFRARFARIIAAQNPTVPGFGPDEAPPRPLRPVHEALGAFEAERRETLRMIYGFTPTDWDRPAVHLVYGRTTLRGMIELVTRHDLGHMGQIHDLVALWHARHE